MNWRTIIWYIDCALATISAILTAYTGNPVCFAWAIIAGLAWVLATNSITNEKGDTNDLRD